MTKSISKDTLNQVCLIGQGEMCCRYIMLGAAGFECGKHSEFKTQLDKRVETNTITAKGDNCAGLVD